MTSATQPPNESLDDRDRREADEYLSAKQRFSEAMPIVAEELTRSAMAWTWRTGDDDEGRQLSGYLVREDGAQVRVFAGHRSLVPQPARMSLRLDGVFISKVHRPLYRQFEIFVSVGKSPAQIAKEVARRLMTPDAERAIENARTSQSEADMRREWKRQALAELRAATNNADWSEHYGGNGANSAGKFQITVELSAYDRSVTLSIQSLSVAQAMAILAMQQPQAQPEDN